MQSRIVIAAERTLFRQGLCALVGADTDFRIVGEAAGPDDARRLTTREQPDIILIDSELARAKSGCNLVACLRAESPHSSLIVIGEADRTAVSEAEAELALKAERILALQSGALAYLPARADSAELMRLLKAVAATRACEDVDIPDLTPEDLNKTMYAANAVAKHRITERERTIIAMIAQGLCNKEVAHRLGIGTQTVKNHVSHLLEKLALADRTQLAVYAVEHHFEY